MEFLMNVNLKYIASLSNVSVATASRALRNDPRVRVETRKKIQELASRLNYVPNQQAQSLVTGKTNTIGLVLPNIRTFMHDILDGIEEIFSAEGNNILLGVYNNDGEKELRELNLLLQKRVDGIILFHIGSLYDYQVAEMFRGCNTPLVLIDRKIKGAEFDTVINNNFMGIDSLVKEAVDAGYKKIAFIYETENVETMQQRVEGYIQALKKYNIDYRSEYLVTSNFHKTENGYESMKKISRLAEPPEVVISSTGDNILGVVKFLLQNPDLTDKYKISGFDDLETLDYIRIPISRLDMQQKTVGKAAAELLYNNIQGQSDSVREVVVEPLHIRRWS